MSIIDWQKYKPYFQKSEFTCSHSGKNRMRPEFMDTLMQIRKTYGNPMTITSGYRDISHPIEAKKHKPGEHTYGLAADISIDGIDAVDLIVIAYGYGIRRFGIGKNFLHIGVGDRGYGFPPSMWTY